MFVYLFKNREIQLNVLMPDAQHIILFGFISFFFFIVVLLHHAYEWITICEFALKSHVICSSICKRFLLLLGLKHIDRVLDLCSIPRIEVFHAISKHRKQIISENVLLLFSDSGKFISSKHTIWHWMKQCASFFRLSSCFTFNSYILFTLPYYYIDRQRH